MGNSTSSEADAEAEAAADAAAAADTSTAHDLDADQWSEEFSREYSRLRQVELGLDLDEEQEANEACDDPCFSGALPARMPLKEMMIKESLSEIQSMLGPVMSRDADPYERRRGGDYLVNGAGKRPRLAQVRDADVDALVPVSATGDPRDVPVEFARSAACSSADADAYADEVGTDGCITPPPMPDEWRAGMGGGAQPSGRYAGGYASESVQKQNVSELNATMEAALSALYDDGGTPLMHGLGTPQYTLQTPPHDARYSMTPLHLGSPAIGSRRSHADDDGLGPGGYLQDGDGDDYSDRYHGDPDERLFDRPLEMYGNGEEDGRTPFKGAAQSEADGEKGRPARGGKAAWEGKIWTHAEDTIILEGVAQMGFKWRRIAAMLPNRSDDAVRNRWHRLEEARRQSDTAGAGESTYERSSVYKCSRCGQPKKHHVCLAPEETSRAEEVKAKKIQAKDTQRLTWSREEDDIILRSVEEFGPKWLEIAARLPGRTDHAARNRYHRLQRCHRPADALAGETGAPPLDAASLRSEGEEGETAAWTL